MKLFKRKKRKANLGYFVICDFSNEAIRLGLPGPKVLLYFYNGYLIKRRMFMDPVPEMEELKSEGVFVKDLTYGKEISPNSMFVPKIARLAGVLQTQKFIRGMQIVDRVERK